MTRPANSQGPLTDLEPKLLRQLQHAACVAELCPGVTHKLNNALAGALSNLELITMEKSLPTEVLESHKWSQQAAWKAADLNRAFVEFLTRSDHTSGPVDLDGLLSQTAQFLRRFSDRRVEISHTPTPQRIYSPINSTVLAENIVTLVLLGQRLLTGGGSIRLSASLDGSRAIITLALDPSTLNAGVVQPESPRLLNWLAHSLAQSVGATLEVEMHESRVARFLLRLPGAA